MDFLKKLDLKPLQILKIGGVIVVALLVLSFAFQLIGSSFGTLSRQLGVSQMMGVTAPSMGYGGGSAYDGGYDYAVSESAMMPQLSARNVAGSLPPYTPSPSGDTAEEYEVTQYSARIETRHLQDTCDTVLALKAREDVIFEQANTYERGCSFTFKVKHDSVEEVLALVEQLDPRELSENTYTIKRQVDDFTNEEEVLQKKSASIDATLSGALSAYDDITRLATQTQNADALAKIIDSRVQIIERLTQERININEQLDRLSRAKADQLDRLAYTYFNVNVYEDKFVDGRQLADSWKEAVKAFVNNLNGIVQSLTINLVLLILFIAQWLLYALIALLIAKYGWKVGKYLWFK